MASTSYSSAPVRLLHEGEGHVVTVELKSGETYRGLLAEAEDTMNCHMKEVDYHSQICIFVLFCWLLC